MVLLFPRLCLLSDRPWVSAQVRSAPQPFLWAALVVTIGAACTSMPPARSVERSAGSAAVGASSPQALKWQTAMKQISGPFRCDQPKDVVVTDKDGGHLACVTTSTGRVRVLRDGKSSAAYDHVQLLGFSPDGRKLAYRARVGGKTRIIVDDQTGAEYRAVHDFAFSPDGRFVYVGELDHRSHVVVDGRAGPAFDDIDGLAFSADGTRFAYVAHDRGKARVIVDGHPEAEYDKVAFFAFSWEGSTVGYVGRSDEVTHVVIDGKATVAGGEVETLVLSREGMRYAYVVRSGQAVHAVVDGQEHSKYSIIRGLTFHGENSTHLAYHAVDEVGGHIVHDGKPSPAFRLLDWAAFSPRQGHWAFAARDVGSSSKGIAVVVGDEIRPMTPKTTYVHHRGFTRDGEHVAVRHSKTDGVERECLLVDGLPGPEFEKVMGVTISPDGARVAYVARSADTDSVVLDGHTGLAFGGILGLLFSPDGRRLAYIAGSKTDKGVRMRAVVDGRAGAEFEVIRYMVFSPDSRRFAFVALEGGGAVRVVVDGQPSPTVSPLESLGIARSGVLWPVTRRDLKCRRGEDLATGCSHDVPVRFSEDSRSYLYLTSSNEKARVVLDGDLMPAMDEIVAEDLDFDSDGNVSYLAINDGALFRVWHRRAAVVD